jgi:hypothetical protein
MAGEFIKKQRLYRYEVKTKAKKRNDWFRFDAFVLTL